MIPLYSLCRGHNFFLIKQKFHCLSFWKTQFISDIWRLKPNSSKCKIARLGGLKGVQVVVYGMSCIDLRNWATLSEEKIAREKDAQEENTELKNAIIGQSRIL